MDLLSYSEIDMLGGMIKYHEYQARLCDNRKGGSDDKEWELKMAELLQKTRNYAVLAQSRIDRLQNNIRKTCANALELGYCKKSDCENCNTRKVLNDK